jgi:hypothetical protein
MLAGHQQEIQSQRDRKLEAARKQRKSPPAGCVKENDAQILRNGSEVCVQTSYATLRRKDPGVRGPGSDRTVPARDPLRCAGRTRACPPIRTIWLL